MIFRDLLGNENPAAEAIFFALRSDKGQRDITQALAKAVITDDPEFCRDVIKTINEAGKLAGKRNAVIHAFWLVSHAEETAIYWPGSDNRAFEGVNVVEKLQADLKEIDSMAMSVFSTHQRVEKYMETAKPDPEFVMRLSKALLTPLPEQSSLEGGGLLGDILEDMQNDQSEPE